MLSDRQLRDYVEGSLLPAQRAELERLVADVPGSLRDIVAQERIDQALWVALGDETSSERIKQSVLAIMLDTPQPDVVESEPESAPPSQTPSVKSRPATRRNPAVLAGLAAATGIGMLVIVHQLGNIARVDVAAPGTELIRHGKSTPASGGNVLRKDDALRVGESATVEYSDATLITLGSGSSVTFAKSLGGGKGKRIEVRAGSLRAVVRAQPSGEPIMIASQQAIVSSDGATFALSVDPALTRVEVSAGVLRIERASDKNAVDVRAGEFAEVGTDGELAAHPLHPAPPESK